MIKRNSVEIDSNYRRFSVVSRERMSPLQWEEIPELSNLIYSSSHVIASIDSYIFIHGGIKNLNSIKPSNDFHRINIETHKVDNLTSSESPYLSQHACVVFSKKYILLIGGWNGHSRLSDVYIFDSQALKWLSKPVSEGFPKGAGLSSHTANAVLKSHSNFPDILIIGREGSTRIQRRYGNAYRLSSNNNLTKFTYTEFPLDIDSRSGHTTSVIHSKLYIVGGRDDKVIDIHKVKDLIPEIHCDVVSKFITNIEKYELQKCPLAGKRKAGRKGHCFIPGRNGFIITGGTSFQECSVVADSAGFVYSESPNDGGYYFLGTIENTRTNGASIVNDFLESIYHGGVDINGKIKSEFLKLRLVE